MEKPKMETLKKKLDYLKMNQERIQELELTVEVRELKERQSIVQDLRKSIKDMFLENLILKPLAFGIRKNFQMFANQNLKDVHIAKDRKNIQGILKGENEQATFKLTHKAPYEIKSSSILTIKDWR
tara:strand:+ start:173 stop:550 length:378 start_codon:yes stop_codon:yes gene_type:complete